MIEADKRAAEKRAAAEGTPVSRLRLFLRSVMFDFLLVLIISTGVVYTVSFGFNSAPDLRGNIAVIAACSAVLLACLYIGMWSKRMMLLSALAYAICAGVVIVLISLASPEQVPFFADNQVNDVEGNYAVFAIVVVVVPLLEFLVSRKPWGVVTLIFLNALACGTIQFLYRDWLTSGEGTLAALIVLGSTGALLVLQGYRRGILSSNNLKRTSFGTTFLFGVSIAAICIAVGVGLFYGVVAGLGLSTIDVKPFEEYYSRPVVEYDGTYEQQEIIDPDLATSTLSDDEEDTIDDAEGESDEEQEDDSGGGFNLVSAVADMLDMDSWNSSLNPVNAQLPLSLALLLAALPFIIIIAIILLRRHMRKRRLQQIEKHEIPDRIILLYDYFLSRFKKLKIERNETWTPLEFALSQNTTLAGFSKNPSKADFLVITLLYQRAAYGARNLDANDYAIVLGYYNAFFKNAMHRVGYLRWAFNYFWRI